jgi:cell division protein FtsX
MKTQRHTRNRKRLLRSGMMSLEVVMTIAVMVPIAGALFFLGMKMCAAAYEAISALVSWPFL